MPTITIWADPEVYLTHKGVTVFHTYADDDKENGKSASQFTLDGCSDEHPFLITDLDVPSRALLANTPPFLCATINPLFAWATEEQKAEWKKQWEDWFKHGGTFDAIKKTIITEAIDQGLLTAPEGGEGIKTCDDCQACADSIILCPDGAQICQQCFDAGAH